MGRLYSRQKWLSTLFMFWIFPEIQSPKGGGKMPMGFGMLASPSPESPKAVLMMKKA
jgi:hypothetical protein